MIIVMRAEINIPCEILELRKTCEMYHLHVYTIPNDFVSIY